MSRPFLVKMLKHGDQVAQSEEITFIEGIAVTSVKMTEFLELVVCVGKIHHLYNDTRGRHCC